MRHLRCCKIVVGPCPGEIEKLQACRRVVAAIKRIIMLCITYNCKQLLVHLSVDVLIQMQSTSSGYAHIVTIVVACRHLNINNICVKYICVLFNVWLLEPKFTISLIMKLWIAVHKDLFFELCVAGYLMWLMDKIRCRLVNLWMG